MSKTTLRHKMQAYGQRLVAAIIMVAACTAGYTVKAATDAPAITKYYPGKNDASPMELKSSSKAYIYFESTAKVVSAKAAIIQGTETIGTCTYDGKETGVSTVTLDPSATYNSDLSKIQAGNFTLNVYEVTYLTDGEATTYSDINNPLGSVTYRRPAANGCIVSTTGLEDNTVRSYFPADGTEGVRTYTFDRPVIADNIRSEYQYGQGNVYLTTRIPSSLSEDGKTLTIDLRGKCYNQDVLAPGVTFVDDYGNPCDPPTRIEIIVTGLNCQDGTKIETISYSYDGTQSQRLEGQIFEIFDYEDLTFNTPRLTSVEFYAANNPGTRYNNINPDTDMMELMISNKSAIQSADIIFVSGTLQETVPFAEITQGSGSYIIALPASVRSTGSSDLTIGLTNVTFAMEDGAQHEINTLSTSAIAPDITTVAELKDSASGAKVVFNAIEGIKITMANEAGYIFAEDSTGAIQIINEGEKALAQGTLVQGRLSGIYAGNGVFMIDLSASDYTVSDIDVTTGLAVNDLNEALNDSNINRLVTINATEDIAIVYNEDMEMIIINDIIPVITNFAEGIDLTEPISSVTGILYYDYDLELYYVILRSSNDTTSIATIVDLDNTDTTVYDLRGIKVSTTKGATLPQGIYIINGKKTLVK